MTRDLAGLRVLLVHEWLYTWAGAERCLEELLNVLPHADVVAGTVTPDIRRSNAIAARARETWLGHLPGARAHHRWFLPLHAPAFATIDTSSYDVVISLSHAFAKLVPRSRRAVHLCYCFSPPRYLWDLHTTYVEHAPGLQRLALTAARGPLRALDRWGASRVDRFVSISSCVAERVRRAYGRDSDVVYPPVARKSRSTAAARGDFLLTLGRLVPYKRVDLAIRAAERLQMRLVVAGDGPDRQRLQSMAGKHVEFPGEVSEDHAAQLLSNCRAFVFCAEEDFGIAPVEANAHGAPVIAYARGGALETIVDGSTGVHFHEQTTESLCAAIERCIAMTWNESALSRNAARFAPERFREGMRHQLARALEG